MSRLAALKITHNSEDQEYNARRPAVLYADSRRVQVERWRPEQIICTRPPRYPDSCRATPRWA
jgi:hypothetical protein